MLTKSFPFIQTRYRNSLCTKMFSYHHQYHSTNIYVLIMNSCLCHQNHMNHHFLVHESLNTILFLFNRRIEWKWSKQNTKPLQHWLVKQYILIRLRQNYLCLNTTCTWMLPINYSLPYFILNAYCLFCSRNCILRCWIHIASEYAFGNFISKV